jgi:hypothetical protein
MAKIRIPLEKLPPPNKEGNHTLRYRVSSEDRNSISQWSRLFSVTSIGQISPNQVDARIVALKQGGPYELSWKEEITIQLPSGSFVKRKISEYDLFIKWNYNEKFQFYARVASNNTVIFSEEATSPESLRVVGQLPTYPFPPELLDDFKVFDTGVVVL